MTLTPRDESKVLHSAGATVRHSSPFEALDVPARRETPSAPFIDKWIKPFYLLNLASEREAFVAAVRAVLPEMDEQVAAELLSYLNWRPRIVGAYFVAVKRMASLESLIGRLLLRSDVCDAGRGYCVALARLNTPAAAQFLEEYLDYYLTRPDLWFDQGFAMAALGHLDKRNGTARRDRFRDRWEQFISDKPNWDLARDDEIFELTIQTIEAAESMDA